MVVPLKSMFPIAGICEFLLRKNIFADVIKLRLLWQDHPELFKWALNLLNKYPCMTEVEED